MAEVVMCEPWELFNLLNQQRNSVSRLAQSNYLCLFGEENNNNPKTHSQTRYRFSQTISSLPLHIYKLPSLLSFTDAQEIQSYRTCHIITAMNIKQVGAHYVVSTGHVITAPPNKGIQFFNHSFFVLCLGRRRLVRRTRVPGVRLCTTRGGL